MAPNIQEFTALMGTFRFKLEPLLEVRRAAEQQQQRIVASLEAKRRAMEQRLARQNESIEQGRLGLRGHLIGDLTMADLRAQAASVNQSRRSAEQIARELAVIMKQTDEARAALREAMARRRAIELLKERRLQEWKRQELRAEQAAMDELAVINAARQEMQP